MTMAPVEARPAEWVQQGIDSSPVAPLRAPLGLAWGRPSAASRLLHQAALGLAVVAHAGLLADFTVQYAHARISS